MYIYKKEIYKYITKKYYTIFLVKKRKYRNCENLSSKYTTDGN